MLRLSICLVAYIVTKAAQGAFLTTWLSKPTNILFYWRLEGCPPFAFRENAFDLPLYCENSK